MILRSGTDLNEVREDLIRELCIGRASLYLDYWGCWAEVFSVRDPPGAIIWENFIAPIRAGTNQYAGADTQPVGCYILSNDNVLTILSSLEAHRSELEIMDSTGIERLRSWLALCRKHPEISVLYQADF